MSAPPSGLVERYADGEVIIREGDTGRSMYVIRRGAVEVTKALGGRTVVLSTLERGSFFGEMSLLESLPRNATVSAKGDTELLVIEPGALLLKFRRDPTFAFEMLQHMSRRIRDLDEQLIAAMRVGKVPSTSETPVIRTSSLLPRSAPPGAAERSG